MSSLPVVKEIKPKGIKKITIRLGVIEEALPRIPRIEQSPLTHKVYPSGGSAKCANCIFCRHHSTTYAHRIGTCFGGEVTKIVSLDTKCSNHSYGKFAIRKMKAPRNWRIQYERDSRN